MFKRVYKGIVLSLVFVLSVCSLSYLGGTEVYGAVSSILLSDSDRATLDTICSDKSLLIKTVPTLHDEDSSGESEPLFLEDSQDVSRVRLNKESLQLLSSKNQTKLLSEFINDMTRSDMSKSGQRKVYNAIKEALDPVITSSLPTVLEDTRVNIFKAISIMRPFNGTVGTIMGIAIILIVTALLMGTLLDLSWMGLPLFQNFAETNLGSKESGRPKFVSQDAFKALQQSIADNGTWKNAYALYFKKRVLTYFLLMLCIFYLISNQLYTLIVFLYDVSSNAVDTLTRGGN